MVLKKIYVAMVLKKAQHSQNTAKREDMPDMPDMPSKFESKQLWHETRKTMYDINM